MRMQKIGLILLATIVLFLLNTLRINAQENLSKAETYYAQENYLLALKYYTILFREDRNNIEYNERIGECFLKTNINKGRAANFYEFVVKNDTVSPNIELRYNLALAYYYDQQFENAIENIALYSNSPQTQLDGKRKAGRLLEIVLTAEAQVARPQDVEFINLGEEINTNLADYNPIITTDERFLFFASRRSRNVSNIYYSERDSATGQWGAPKSVGNFVNTRYDEILAGISTDGEQIFVHYNDGSPMEDINMATKESDYYINLESVGEFINTSGREEGVFLTAGKDTLIFASERDDGFGGLDLYMSLRLPNGNWGIATNLGPTVNTAYDENYPWMTTDGSQLYFSSQGRNTIGGYDIFVSGKDSTTGGWDYPVNLGYPINDMYHNRTFVQADNARYAYISSVRDGGVGDYDIYKVVFNSVEPQYLIYTGLVLVGDPDSYARVADVAPDISISLYEQPSGELFGTYAYKPVNGKYVMAIPPGNYKLEITGDAYRNFEEIIEVKEATLMQRVFIRNFYIKPK